MTRTTDTRVGAQENTADANPAPKTDAPSPGIDRQDYERVRSWSTLQTGIAVAKTDSRESKPAEDTDVAPSRASPKTLVEVMNHWANVQPNQRAFTFVNGEGEVEASVSFGGLKTAAQAVAGELMTLQRHSHNAILMYPPGIDFIVAFIGCLYAGVAPTPVHMPKRNRLNTRLLELIKPVDPIAILSTQKTLEELEAIRSKEEGWPTQPVYLATDTASTSRPIPYRFPIPCGSTTAFLQFTSGSTSAPRGVVVTHGNCIYNLEMMQSVRRTGPDTVFLSWLPHFHDLGLVAHILSSFFCGSHCVLLSPLASSRSHGAGGKSRRNSGPISRARPISPISYASSE